MQYQRQHFLRDKSQSLPSLCFRNHLAVVLEMVTFFCKLKYIYIPEMFLFYQKFHIVAKKDTWNCLESHRFSYEMMNALNSMELE